MAVVKALAVTVVAMRTCCVLGPNSVDWTGASMRVVVKKLLSFRK